MLTGKQKAQVLLSMLGDKSKNVLSLLSPAHAALLMDTIEESPKPAPSVLNALMNEIMQKVSRVRETGALEDKEDKKSLFSSLSLGNFSSAEEEDTSGEVSSAEGQKMRSPDQIAALLVEQRPQLVAFVLSKLDDAQRQEIETYLPVGLQEQLGMLRVDDLPLSQRVFENLYNEIFIASPEEVLEESAEPQKDRGFFF